MLMESKSFLLIRRQVAQSPLFHDVPQVLLDELLHEFRYEYWRRKAIPSKGSCAQYFYLLLSGRLEVVHTHPETGRSVTLYLLQPGDGFDVIVLLDGEPHDMALLSDTDVEVLAVPIDTMRQWIWNHPEINRNLMPYLARRMREQEEMTANIALYDTVSRLSRLILKHATLNRDYRGDDSEAHRSHLVNGFSDEMLARMIGSVRQVVNKHLQLWQRSGFLKKQRNSLEIKDLRAIERVARDFLDSLKKSA